MELEKENRFNKARDSYRRICGFEAEEPITEIYENYLTKVARENGIIDLDELREYFLGTQLNEDSPMDPKLDDKIEQAQNVTPEQAEQAVDMAKQIDKNTDGPLDVVYIEGDFEKRLDRCYNTAMRAHLRGESDKFAPNLCAVGSVGTGKTERFKA